MEPVKKKTLTTNSNFNQERRRNCWSIHVTCCRANGGECIKQMLRRNLHLNKALQSKCLEMVPRQHCLKVKVEIRKKSVEGGWEERGGVEHCDATYVLCIVLVDGTVDRNFPRLCRRRRWRWARHFVCLFYDPWTKGLKPVLEPGRGPYGISPYFFNGICLSRCCCFVRRRRRRRCRRCVGPRVRQGLVYQRHTSW